MAENYSIGAKGKSVTRLPNIRLRTLFLCLPVLVLSFSLLSCQTIPETNRSQLILINRATEMRLGEVTYRETLDKSRISGDKRLTSILRTVGQNIANVAGRPDFRWEFNLIEKEAPNAYCLPGGKVGVHTGILPIAQNEAGLAAVIGHEVGHAIARHGAERMSHGILLGVAGELLARGLTHEDANRNAFRAAYAIGATMAVQLPFSRSHELEADYLGLLYMARAGYDPREAKKFWSRFAAWADKNGGKNAPEFLSTHPTGEHRIDQIERLMNNAMVEYNRASVRHGAGRDLL